MLKILSDKKPHYIKTNCNRCNTSLVNFDDLWKDEWICPICWDQIYLDWTFEDFQQIEKLLD